MQIELKHFTIFFFLSQGKQRRKLKKVRKPPKGGDLPSLGTTKHMNLSIENKDKVYINPSPPPPQFMDYKNRKKKISPYNWTQSWPYIGVLSEIIPAHVVKEPKPNGQLKWFLPHRRVTEVNANPLYKKLTLKQASEHFYW